MDAAEQAGGQRVLRLGASDFVFIALLVAVLVCVLPYKVLRVLRKVQAGVGSEPERRTRRAALRERVAAATAAALDSGDKFE